VDPATETPDKGPHNVRIHDRREGLWRCIDRSTLSEDGKKKRVCPYESDSEENENTSLDATQGMPREGY